jgi:DNA-binding transcriptional ArsR family regulator
MPLPNATDLNRAAAVFRALAHPHRILLACCLANGRTATQSELLEELGWPQSTMARHLGALRDRGLVRGTRHGNQVLLALDGTITPQLLAAVCAWVHPDTGDRFASVLTAGAEGHA